MAPTPGNYRSTPGPVRARPEAKKEQPAEPVVAAADLPKSSFVPSADGEAAEPQSAAPAADKKEEEIPPTPAELYRKRLEEAKIPIEQAHSILDDMMTQGFHEHRGEMRTPRHTVYAVFRTRSYKENARLLRAFEVSRPTYEVNQRELVTRYRLASTLVDYNGTKLASGTDKEHDAAMSFIMGLPEPIFNWLSGELAKFDERINLIFSDGCFDSF